MLQSVLKSLSVNSSILVELITDWNTIGRKNSWLLSQMYCSIGELLKFKKIRNICCLISTTRPRIRSKAFQKDSQAICLNLIKNLSDIAEVEELYVQQSAMCYIFLEFPAALWFILGCFLGIGVGFTFT